jgi:hypothetical protein
MMDTTHMTDFNAKPDFGSAEPSQGRQEKTIYPI